MVSPPVYRKYAPVLLGFSVLAGLYLSSLYSYLLFHSLAEMFSIVVAFGIFMLAWNSRRFMDNGFLLFLGIAYLFVGSMDFLHTLAYRGMGVFKGGETNLPTQLWITARYVESASLLVAPLFLGRKLRPNLLFAAYAALTAVLLGSIFTGVFPDCFVEGRGLTPFKKVSEYLISLILAGSLFLLYIKRGKFDRRILGLVTASIILTMFSELAFTFYVSAYGFSNLVGHFLKIISFYLIYKAIIETGLMEPYSLLFSNLRKSEAKTRAILNVIPDLMFRIKRDGTFVDFKETKDFPPVVPPEEFMGKKVSEILPPDVARQTMHCIDKALGTGAMQVFEYRLTQDGSPRDYEARIVPAEEDGVIAIVRDITRSKKREETLKLFSEAVESAPDGVQITDMDGFIVYSNRAVEEIYGFSAEELRGKHVNEMNVNPEFAESAILPGLRKAGRWTGEFMVKHKNGREFPIWLTTSVVKNEKGVPIALVGVIRDITERRRAEEALRVKDSAIASSINAIAMMDLEGKLTYVNSSFLRMWGYEDEGQVIGKPAISFWYDRERALEVVQFLKEKGSHITELVARKKEGLLFDVQLAASMVMDSRGSPMCMLASIIDVTKRKQAEEMLREHHMHLEEEVRERTAELTAAVELLKDEVFERRQAEEDLAEEKERLAVTLRSIGDAVITTDIEGRITLVNKAAEELTGWSQEKAAGRPFDEVFAILDENTRQCCPNPAAAVHEGARPAISENQRVLIARDGVERTVAESGLPIHDIDGRTIGMVMVYRDITEKRMLEEELLKAQKLESLGILAGGIAHDFNNVLTAILNNIYIAKTSARAGDAAFKRLTAAERAALRAQNLTRQLLTFSRGGAPVRKPVSVSELIEESVEFALQGSNVRCEYSVSEDLWPVEADEGQISQVISNLVINADQSMPDGGSIEVSAVNITLAEGDALLLRGGLRGGSYVRVSFRDSGVGIPEEYLGRIFDPYFTTKQKGSGLGLATTYSIVKNHEGHIDVRSRRGEGTVFSVYLPASEENIPSEGQLEGAVNGKGKILVMDDETEVRDSVGEVLAHFGYEADFAGDGLEAVEAYRRAMDSGRPFNAVIMDLTIPGGMGGLETMRKLREMDPYVKAVVCSGYSNDPVMSDYKKHGFSGIVTKPYQIEELVSLLRKIIKY
jgi:PAS domain S-box-containing protein